MKNKSLNYKNILLKHKKCIVNSRSECDISTNIAGKKVAAPVFCSNMISVLNKDIVLEFDKANWFHIWHRIGDYAHVRDYVKWANEQNLRFVSISIGIKQVDVELLNWIKERGYRVDSICIDLALSYTDRILPIINEVQNLFPNTYLIVGNGDSPEWVQWLESYGVNACKINIGVSKSCRTREFTGFSSTTISDLETCKNAASKIDILSDGGLTVDNEEVWIGDIAKSIRFGADFVMSGALFKNCIDSPAILNGYYGNASRKAKGNSQNVEGAHLEIKTNGLTIKQMIKLIEDSLKSSVSYSGWTQLTGLRYVDYQIID